jgi:hypothetical protein
MLQRVVMKLESSLIVVGARLSGSLSGDNFAVEATWNHEVIAGGI